MTKKKPIPWLEIKAEYLSGCKPDELSKKYKVDIEKLYNKIDNSGWNKEKTELQGNIRNKIETDIKDGSQEAVRYLRGVVSDENQETRDRISAAKGLLDISGLKSSKQEITGKDGSALIQKVYVTEKETEFTDNHIDSVINEQ